MKKPYKTERLAEDIVAYLKANGKRISSIG